MPLAKGTRSSAWRILPSRLSVPIALLAAALLATPAATDEVADFYKDKTLTILIGTGPGGSYDLYGRIIAMHLSRHIPGHPTIIVEHMPGAGGANAGNHIYNVAPQDGTRLLLSHALPLVEKLLGGKGIHFETRKFHWLGAYDAIVQAMTLWHTVPVDSLDDLKNKDFVIGAFNNTHLTYQWAMLTKDVLGAKFKVITGYRGGNDLNLAMERGEIHGWTASWENIVGSRPDWLRDKKVKMLLQYTLDRQSHLPVMPTLLELAPPDKKDVVEFIAAGTPIARAMAVAPGVPAARVAALRQAFEALMKDEAFLADAAKRQLDIHPRNAASTQALVEKIASASPELVARVKKAIGQVD
jgi:tripartite-type tricarboxylate transporter receptor subunit TctC